VDLFVIGAGYVGLTTAVGFTRLGHRVIVQDIDASRVAALRDGVAPIWEPGLVEAIAEGSAAGRLSFVTDPAPPAGVDFALVCVPTPIGPDGVLDVSKVEASVHYLHGILADHQAIVVRSTMALDAPARLEAIVGDRVRPAVTINPEFMREGRALADFAAPSRVIVGHLRPSDRDAAARFASLYEPLGAPIIVADARSVVLIKLASNVFLGTKIAFANELARLCDAIGADAAVVTDGIGMDARIGRSFLDPGPGFGGSCLPEQAEAIAVEAGMRRMRTPLFSAIAQSNATHRDEIVTAVASLLADGLPGARIGLLGLAFKADTDDVRRSPALDLAALLRGRGARVLGYDPVAEATARRADPHLETVPSVAAAARGADALLVATEWREFETIEWQRIAGLMGGDLVYDTRRCVDAAAVAAAGLRYVALGRAAVAREADLLRS
jgi:UDPglucose 6-dehydrogenase